jgi:hypothetical protein
MARRSPHAGPDLARLQREFQDYVLQRDPAVLQQVRQTAPADRAARMQIYAEGYELRLLEALQTDYPGLSAIAGPEQFDALGRAYIAAHPSSFRNLRWYGERLSQFLESAPPWSDRPELAEMARFEWAMASSFDALDAACLSRDALVRIVPDSWPRLSFIVHPAVQRIELTTNVPAMWAAQSRGEAVPASDRGPATAWLLTRRDFQVRFRSMAPEEATAFDRLAARIDFAQWCSELGAAERAVELLNQWLADGALAGYALEPPPSAPAPLPQAGEGE